jgi:Protein of unknown function (DUF1579)
MTTSNVELPRKRGAEHEALSIFLGEWKAVGKSFGGTEQPEDDTRRNGVEWTSTHTGRWHTGEFFLIQEEKARPGGDVFDTLSVMGVDAKTGQYFSRSFENHGFYRHYDVSVNSNVWTITGEHERARIEFSEDNRTQIIKWEWKPADEWLPLCDRIAIKI